MDLLDWLNNLFSFNFTVLLVGTYILTSLTFCVFFSSVEKLAFPVILKSVLYFSLFLLQIIILLFCCDFSAITCQNYFFSQNFQLFFLILSCFVFIITRDFTSAQNISKFEYDVLLCFVILSALCLCFADDFLLVYIALEIQSLCFYVFAIFNRNSEFSTESGLKYFVFGGVISCFLLFGISILFLCCGSTSFEFLSHLVNASTNNLCFMGIIFILITFLFKIGASPFHAWLCDVYDGAIICVTLLFAAQPKIIIFSLFIKLFLLIFGDFGGFWTSLFLFTSVLSIAVGSLSALYQKRLKRLFAYSTISHTGFMLLAFIVVSSFSASALIFYIIIYSALTILLFSLLIFSVITQKKFPAYIVNWTSSSLRNYVFIVSFSLVLFSIAGIPPLSGFFSKLAILTAIISNQYYFTSIAVVVLSSIASFYYIRLIKTFFFVKVGKNNFWISPQKRQGMELVIGFLTFANLFLILYPQLLAISSIVLSIMLF